MSELNYEGVTDIGTMFDVLSDARVARAMTVCELQDIARMVGVADVRCTCALSLAGAIRTALCPPEGADDEAPPATRATCDCEGRGTRWAKADDLQPVLVHIDPAVDSIYGGTVGIMRERLAYLAAQTSRLRFEYTTYEQADIVIDAMDSDGPGGTLGFAQSYRGEGEDLDVFGDVRWSVRISMDPAEMWTAGFLRTVFLHEALHAVGIAHIDVEGSLMRPFYSGVQLVLAQPERDAVENLYGAPIADTVEGVPA